MKKKVRDLIGSRPSRVVWVKSSDTLEFSVRMMAAERVGSVIVMEGGVPAGILTERDVVRCLADPQCAGDMRVGAAMSRGLRVVELDDTIEYATQVMRKKGIRHLPVVDNGSILDVISIRDVAFVEVEELQGEVRMLMDYIFS